MANKPISLAERRLKPVDSVVQSLREWLKLAKEGQLRGIVIGGEVLEDGDGVYRYSYQGEISSMEAASVCEQHAHSLRARLYGQTTDAEDVDVDEEDE